MSVYARCFWLLFTAFLILLWYYLFATGWTTDRRLNYTIRRAQNHSSLASYREDLAHMRDVVAGYRTRLAGLESIIPRPQTDSLDGVEAVVNRYLELATRYTVDERRARQRLRQFFDSYEPPPVGVLNATQRRGARTLLWVVGLATALSVVCRMQRIEY